MVNFLQLQQRREGSSTRSSKALWTTTFPLRFSHFTAKEFESAQQHELHIDAKPCYATIKEIYILEKLIITLSCAGVCCMFNRHSGCFITVLNTCEQIIQTIFYNKHNHTLIIVFVTRYDNFSSLRCEITTLNSPSSLPLEWKTLFRTEVLKHPGFVEFDEINRKIVTFCAVKRIYKVWDMDTSAQLYAATNNTREIKISEALLLLVGFGGTQFIPLKIVAIASGEVLKTHHYPLTLGKKVAFVEMFQDKILIKQEGKRLQVMNFINGSTIDVRLTKNVPAERILSLTERRMFLGLSSEGMVGWNYDGEIILRVTTEFNLLFNTKMFISATQNIIIITHEGSTYGLDVHTGKYVRIMSQDHLRAKITAVAYDEATNEMFCGDELGEICMWS